jgi:hypothetical protein
MQKDDCNIIDVYGHIESTSNKLLAMKETSGQNLTEFLDSFLVNGCFNNVAVVKSEADDLRFNAIRCQFFQALHDNIIQRFPLTKFLAAAAVLNKATWPSDPLQRALFGEAEIVYICKEFQLPSSEIAEILMAYSLFKLGQAMSDKLTKFVQLLKVLPVSTAACERGFSQLNLHHTSLRNRLEVETVSHLMMVSINGPPLSAWLPRKYVISWLKSGRHGALDKATGPAKVEVEIRKSARLFL